MPKISTHLHLALKLSEKIKIEDATSFYLGTAYPDCWSISLEQGLARHYKNAPESLCDMEQFLENEEMSDFNLGYLFHLWTDNRMKDIDTGDISKYDCIICDMPVIGSLIEELRQHTFTEKEEQAMQNILSLESEPLPLYLVPDEKRIRYEAILDQLVDEFRIQHIK